MGTKTDSEKTRLDYTNVSQLLLEMIGPSLAREANAPSRLDVKFPLHHPRICINNIFIDDNCEITCIIDWAFSSTVPFSTLPVTPGMPHSWNEPDLEMDTAFKIEFKEDQSSYDEVASTDAGRYAML